MRPLGGVLGGMATLGGGTEHQMNGAPHLHMEGHVVCVYQYGTLKEVADKIKQAAMSLNELTAYNSHLHQTDIMDAAHYNAFRPHMEAEFDKRFADPPHDAKCATPGFIADDAQCNMKHCVICGPNSTAAQTYETATDMEALQKDGAVYRQKYMQDAQFVFSRVQHRVHRNTKRGYVPLHNCAKKKE